VTATVVELRHLDPAALEGLLSAYGLELIRVGSGAEIPASYWGAPEAGIAGSCVFARDDTPAHSLLHEISHYVCMTAERRTQLWRDAGGDDEEESAVCYLQVLLAERLPGLSFERLLEDLDAWGYSFREGSAAAWFCGDGLGSRRWLAERALIDDLGSPTLRLRR
jgi:hypothetical protein